MNYNNSELIISIFDGFHEPKTVRLNSSDTKVITFGRSESNNIQLESLIVSSDNHGRFIYKGGQWHVEDREAFFGKSSSNGIIFNGQLIISKPLYEGDVLRIDDGFEAKPNGVLMVVSRENANDPWKHFSMNENEDLRIGREPECDIVLPHITVSRFHASIIRSHNKYYIIDTSSTNGVTVNNKRILDKQLLHEKDVITITNTKLIFTSKAIYYCYYKSGLSVDLNNILVTRDNGKKIGLNNVDLNIKPGELVAILGGSGSGKSSLLKAACGYLKPDRGNVYINGIDLYRSFDALKSNIGYVPQSDILYDKLTVYDSLMYIAKLRLPSDLSDEEKSLAIDRVIASVNLNHKKNSLINSLSGGEKKRASIAAELLTDPNLLFLDEPASGLDAFTERVLMDLLRMMADNGKTVVLVTHSILQLNKCDKIVVIGAGGNLCFYGTYNESLSFFKTDDVADIYEKTFKSSDEWRNRYDKSRIKAQPISSMNPSSITPKCNKKSNASVLCARNFKLIFSDRKKVLLLLFQGPLLTFFIFLVSDGEQFKQYEMTKSLFFSLTCSAFWVGLMNSIQEICSEKSILKREYMTGLSLNSYVMSKLIVYGVICMFQSAIILLVFKSLIGLPNKGLVFNPFLEVFISTFLTSMAATSTGLLVSSFFKNPDKAMIFAPALLMPQLLFSGLLFDLGEITDKISYAVICRWSIVSYGTTADLNQMTLRLQQKGVPISHEAEDFFRHSNDNLLKAWLILLTFIVILTLLTRLVLSGIKNQEV